MRYHPTLGFMYMPSARLRVQGASGGYLVRTNAAGFRSEREFVPRRDPDRFRVLLFGDSQAAGDGLANPLRFSDRLEALCPGLEVYNHGVSGTGTDQHLLTYREHGSVDHDLVLVVVYAENIRRNARRIVRSRDLSGEEVFRAKPWFEVGPDGLELRGVPVPRDAWTETTLPDELRPHVLTFGEEYSALRNPSARPAVLLRRIIPAGPVRRAARTVIGALRDFDPLPQYRSPHDPEWLLMRAILTAWIAESRTPVVVALLPHETALAGMSDPSDCQARFAELARGTGATVVDLLPDLLDRPADERRELWAAEFGHLSQAGHEAVARALAPVLSRLIG